MSTDTQCQFCRFVVRMQNVPRPDLFHCHRHPPTFGRGAEKAQFPNVAPEEWCGEFSSSADKDGLHTRRLTNPTGTEIV